MKIAITDNDHQNLNEERSVFAAAKMEFELHQCHTEDDLISECADAQILLNQYAPITERVIRALPTLKFVVRYGVGVNNIDVDAATKLGVQIGNIPDYGTNEVADHALALMLSLLRKIPYMNECTKTAGWDYANSIPIHRLDTLIVGVIGLGRIGRNFARKAHSLGMTVLGYDPFYHFGEIAGTEYIHEASIEELITTSDVISLHCPPENSRNMFDLEAFRRMKNSAYIINVSRGGIIDENALDLALKTGEIAGAAIDCFLQEPLLPGTPLFENKNLIVTPHMAWYSEEGSRELNRKVAEEAVRFARGEKIHYPVNIPRKARA